MNNENTPGDDKGLLAISEIFYSIQGEGPDLGNPIIFIRLIGCNLSCSFCDTAYTWNWENSKFNHNDPHKYSKDVETTLMSIGQIIQKLKKIDPTRATNLVVITGGNPLIHQKKLAFKQLLIALQRDGYIIEMEDNGTIAPDDYICDELGIDLYHITPKLANSGLPVAVRDKEKAILKYVEIAQDSNCRVVFKYVVSTPEDFAEVCALVTKYKIPRDSVWLMPEGTSLEETMRNSKWLIERCIEIGFNFTPRLHIQIWGNERGV